MLTNWFKARIKFDDGYFTVGCYAIMLIALIGGTYFRIKGLGKSPFTIDEYYIATSVRNILEHGLPQFECGGYYVRGLLLQYLAVPFFKYGSSDEFYFRLITVLSNLLTVPALYLLGKRVSGRTVACLVVTLFCLSIWEVEFARFARMYSPFQMLFVWYVFFLYKAIIQRDSSAKTWMYLISFLSIFVYEGAVFLVLLNFLPFIVNDRGANSREYALSIVILISAAAFNIVDFRRLGVESYLPADLPSQPAAGPSLPIETPVYLITTLASHPAWMLVSLLPLALSVTAIWRLFLKRRSTEKPELTGPQAALLSVVVILSVLNLYGLMILLLVFAFLVRWLEPRHIKSRSCLFVGSAIVSTFFFWVCYAIFTDGWQLLLETARTSLAERLLIVLFKYAAAIYSKIVFPWLATMPIFTIATALLVLFGVLVPAVKDYEGNRSYLLLIAILLLVSVVTAGLRQPYYEIRYTFFIYPIVLLFLTISLERLAQLIARNKQQYRSYLVGLILGFTVLTEDYGVEHLWDIDSDRVLYRLGYDWYKYLQYYPRLDFRTPARIINENLNAGDIVVTTTYGSPYYLRQVDYFYINYASGKLRGIAGCGGTKEIWANADLIIKPDELFDRLQNAESTIWLILRTGDGKRRWEEIKKIQEIFSRYRIFQSIDGKLDLYKIVPKRDRATEVTPSKAAHRIVQGGGFDERATGNGKPRVQAPEREAAPIKSML